MCGWVDGRSTPPNHSSHQNSDALTLLITALQLSNDGRYLYASYPGLEGTPAAGSSFAKGGVTVFDVQAIFDTLNNPNRYQVDDLGRGIGSPFFRGSIENPSSVPGTASGLCN
jgi:hypothetical protein